MSCMRNRKIAVIIVLGVVTILLLAHFVFYIENYSSYDKSIEYGENDVKIQWRRGLAGGGDWSSEFIVYQNGTTYFCGYYTNLIAELDLNIILTTTQNNITYYLDEEFSKPLPNDIIDKFFLRYGNRYVDNLEKNLTIHIYYLYDTVLTVEEMEELAKFFDDANFFKMNNHYVFKRPSNIYYDFYPTSGLSYSSNNMTKRVTESSNDGPDSLHQLHSNLGNFITDKFSLKDDLFSRGEGLP